MADKQYNWSKKGSVYILTLISVIVLIALLLGLAQRLASARTQQRVSAQSRAAHTYAELGVRHAMRSTRLSREWRDTMPDGVWLDNIQVGEGAYTVWAEDPEDGSLAGDIGTPVKMISRGTVGQVSRTLQVEMEQRPLPLLDNALAALWVEMYDGASIDGSVVSNQYIYKKSTAYISGDANAHGYVASQFNIDGTITEYGNMVLMPGTSVVRRYYKDRATSISVYDIHDFKIDEKVLSPSSNPWGSTNSEGLYYIDCQNKSVTIKDSRVYGTLFLDNANQVKLENSDTMESYRKDYPTLIVYGNFLDQTKEAVSEADERMDLSLPNESGYGSQKDTYENGIKGLVYINGTAVIKEKAKYSGVVIVYGLVQVAKEAELEYDADVKKNNPKCFEEFYLTPQKGSWRDIISP